MYLLLLKKAYLVYLFEAQLPKRKNKSLLLALTNIYGIGFKTSEIVCKKMGFSKNFKTKMLAMNQVTDIKNILESLPIKFSRNLKKLKSLNLKRLIKIKSYKGLRKYRGLPIKGQRTHTNAKTAKKIRHL